MESGLIRIFVVSQCPRVFENHSLKTFQSRRFALGIFSRLILQTGKRTPGKETGAGHPQMISLPSPHSQTDPLNPFSNTENNFINHLSLRIVDSDSESKKSYIVLKPKIQSRVSPFGHYWSLWGGAGGVLCTAGYLAASLAPTHVMPAAPPHTQVDNQK